MTWNVINAVKVLNLVVAFEKLVLYSVMRLLIVLNCVELVNNLLKHDFGSI